MRRDIRSLGAGPAEAKWFDRISTFRPLVGLSEDYHIMEAYKRVFGDSLRFVACEINQFVKQFIRR